jgi:hypothetical protein
LHEAVSELGGGDARDGAAEAPAAPAARGPVPGALAALLAGLPEIQVLNDHGLGAVLASDADELGDGAADTAVAGGGGQPVERERYRERGACDVAVGDDDRDGKVPGVHVDRDHGGRPQLVHRREPAGGGLPGGIQVPPVFDGVVADRVLHCRAGRGAGGDLVAPVGEPDRARQPVAGVRPVREVRERGGEPDLEPVLAGVPPEGLVAEVLASLTVRLQEQPRGLPALAPLLFGDPGVFQVEPGAHEFPRAAGHPDPPGTDLPFGAGEAARERLEPQRLRVALGRARVPGGPPGSGPGLDREPLLHLPHPRRQRSPSGLQVAVGELPRVLRRAGDGARPP